MTIEELRELLKKCWSKETSADPEKWTAENSAWGQCAITALIVQDYFGGELLRGDAKIENKLISHYWNRVPNIGDIDLTKEQFPKGAEISFRMVRDRNYLLNYEPTAKRYALLKLAVENEINPNQLFSDPTYRLCFKAAQSSDCQKMKFGCVAMYKGMTITVTSNKTIEPLRHLCEPDCIRMKIQSRTESMIGACGHAEEWALREITKRNLPLEDCSFYIAGFDATTNAPYIKKEAADFTCLRCAVQMHMAGLGEIWVPFIDHWERITADEAVKESAAYALKEKKI